MKLKNTANNWYRIKATDLYAINNLTTVLL